MYYYFRNKGLNFFRIGNSDSDTKNISFRYQAIPLFLWWFWNSHCDSFNAELFIDIGFRSVPTHKSNCHDKETSDIWQSLFVSGIRWINIYCLNYLFFELKFAGYSFCAIWMICLSLRERLHQKWIAFGIIHFSLSLICVFKNGIVIFDRNIKGF